MEVAQGKVFLVNLEARYNSALRQLLQEQGIVCEVVSERQLLSGKVGAVPRIIVAEAASAYWLSGVAKRDHSVFLLGENIQAHCWANVECLASNFPVAVLGQKIKHTLSLLTDWQRLPRELKEYQLREEIQHLQLELQRATVARDDLLSMASHELRTPLNGLFLDTQLRKLQLQKGNASIFSPERAALMVARDERQLLTMLRIVDDMLDSTRIRTGQLSITVDSMELVALVNEMVERFALRFEMAECPLHWQPNEPVEGYWDSFRIEQIIGNLLTNALRYGGGKPVEISVWQKDGFARVSVKDHGIGIAEGDFQRVFGEFERAVSNHFAPGLGLGLFISEQIANAHGGSIELESVVGQGSTFTLKLPL